MLRALLWPLVRDALIALLLLLAGFLALDAFGSFAKSARAECEEHLPYFEGGDVVEAKRSLRPPMLRCVYEDPGFPQDGWRYGYSAWGYEAIAYRAVPIIAAVAAGWWRLRRWRSHRDISVFRRRPGDA